MEVDHTDNREVLGLRGLGLHTSEVNLWIEADARQWKKLFHKFMKAQGFTRTVFNPSVHRETMNNLGSGWSILVMYVDDMLITTLNRSDVTNLKNL